MKDHWKDAVVYQIYTRSFQDSDGDGVGDFRGVISRLDYLKDLGVDVLWLSPFCASPNDDNGYDVSDYRQVNPEFGTLEDLKELISQARTRGMEVMMDLVFNHTSDEHPWFLESRSSRDNPRRSWYHWADPAPDGGPPNNWNSYFGGSVWELDETTGQYYLHIFSKKQPDLNWDNPEVRQELKDIVRYWIDLGIQAFRLDAIHHIGKPEGYPQYPEAHHDFRLFKNTPETHAYLKELYQEVFGPAGVLTVGETGGTTPQSSRLYVDEDRQELDMIFHFEQIARPDPRDASDMRRHQQAWTRELSKKGWDAQFLSNHDLPRHLSVFGEEGPFRQASAQTLGTFLLTSWGTPYLYQGEEFGLISSYFHRPEDYKDPHGLQGYHGALAAGEDPVLAWESFRYRSRDAGRTPLPWSSAPQGGFTTGTPWMNLGPTWPSINLETDRNSGASVWRWYREVINLRKYHPVLTRGDQEPFGPDHRNVLAFTRKLKQADGQTAWALVILNWSRRPLTWQVKGSLRGARRGEFRLFLGNYTKPAETERLAPGTLSPGPHHRQLPVRGDELPREIFLRPWETRIYLA